MNDSQNFFNLFNGNGNSVSLVDFSINLFLTTILGIILGLIYVRFGSSLSNRKKQTLTLLLVSMTTMLIISIVQSSLALSLGLVGALSIIRFRTAIKEPEELAFFFIAIAVGLGFGANQRITTVVGFFILALVIAVLSKRKMKHVTQNLIVSFNTANEKPASHVLPFVVNMLREKCTQVELLRMDEAGGSIELSFFIDIRNFELLLEVRNQLQEQLPGIQISFLDNR